MMTKKEPDAITAPGSYAILYMTIVSSLFRNCNERDFPFRICNLLR